MRNQSFVRHIKKTHRKRERESSTQRVGVEREIESGLRMGRKGTKKQGRKKEEM